MITEAQVQTVLNKLPEHSFIKNYVDYARQQCGSHLSYHLGCALSLLAVSAPRYLTIHDTGTTYPNLYTVLVGDSGSEKTRAIKVMEALIAEVPRMGELIGSDPTADESFWKMLAEQPTSLFIYEELQGFLSKSVDTDPRGIRSAFTQFYDGGSQTRRYSRGGSVYVVDPRPSFIGACTPIHLDSFTKTLDFDGGWASRHMFWQGARERKVKHPVIDLGAKGWLLDWLGPMVDYAAQYNLPGKQDIHPAIAKPLSTYYGFTPEAADLWDRWTDKISEQYAKEAKQGRIGGMVSRMEQLVPKLALLIAHSNRAWCPPEGWQMDAGTVQIAIDIAELHLQCALSIARNIAGSKEMQEQNRLYAAMTTEWISFGELCDIAQLTKRQANIHLETLREQGRIADDSQGSVMFYKRVNAGFHQYDTSYMASSDIYANTPAPPNPAIINPPTTVDTYTINT